MPTLNVHPCLARSIAGLAFVVSSPGLYACSLVPDGYTPPHGEPAMPNPMGATSQDAGTPSTGSQEDAAAPTVIEFDPTPILAMIADGGYTSTSALALASKPYPSAAAQGADVVEYVSSGSLAAYLSVDPDGGAAVTVPVGTVIVRAVQDSAGTVSKLTLMCKGPSGYNPDLGDWWFGETDPNGVPLEGDGGEEIGRMSGCYSCHVPNASQDFLFGVPGAYQAAH
jgi:hypothetical protein